MAKFHVTDKGVLACTDQSGRCPYLKGEQNNHFNDPVRAEAVFAERMIEQNGQFATMSARKSATPVLTMDNGVRSRLGAPVARNSQQYATAALFGKAKSGNNTGFATKVNKSSANVTPAMRLMASASRG